MCVSKLLSQLSSHLGNPTQVNHLASIPRVFEKTYSTNIFKVEVKRLLGGRKKGKLKGDKGGLAGGF